MTGELPRIGIAVLIWREGRLLLGRRLSGQGAGTWQLPGGHLAPREDVLTCARREVREETGLEVESLAPAVWTENLFEQAGLRYVTLYVTAGRSRGEPRALEPHKAAQWGFFRPAALPTPLFAPLQSLLEAHPGLLRSPAAPLA
jgi:8-oxo-dGTP diphosphatase